MPTDSKVMNRFSKIIQTNSYIPYIGVYSVYTLCFTMPCKKILLSVRFVMKNYPKNNNSRGCYPPTPDFLQVTS